MRYVRTYVCMYIRTCVRDRDIDLFALQSVRIMSIRFEGKSSTYIVPNSVRVALHCIRCDVTGSGIPHVCQSY